MKIRYLLMIGVVLVLSAHSTNAQRSRIYTPSFDSFGPVKIGMKVPQASEALGVSLVRMAGQEDLCYYVNPGTGFKGISFMVVKDRIVRVDIEDKSYRTGQGARIGDTEARIKRLYKGMVTVSPHKYVDGAHYLIVAPKRSRFRIVFETDGKRVTRYRVGKNPEVGFVEGCS